MLSTYLVLVTWLSMIISYIISLKRVVFIWNYSVIGITANDPPPFPGRGCTYRSRAWIDPCVHYIRVHVRILIPPRQLLAYLLVYQFAYLLILVVAWLPYRILTHIHVLSATRPRTSNWTRISLFRSALIVSSVSDLPKRRISLVIPILPIARSRLNLFDEIST